MPSGASFTVSRLLIVWPAAKLTLAGLGRGWSDGHSVRYARAVGPVTATFNTTAPAPLEGTPPRPATCNTATPPAQTGAVGAPLPVRVSRIRDGVNGVYDGTK